MIEETLKTYLQGKLVSPAVAVYFEVPDSPPASFVVLEKTGGGQENYIYSATFAVQCYAETLYKAAQLNERVKGYMLSVADETANVSACSLNSDYNFTDDRTKRYRYQAVYDLTHF